jgi:outer membrane biosynthesis protein TonB
LRTDWTISACCHVVVLGVALVSFAPARLPAPHVESIAVNIVTDTDKSQLTKGVTTAPKPETPNPFVERIGEQKSVDNPAAKIAPREVTASTDATPPPPPPEPKQEAKKKAEPKRDLIADAIKKDDAKKTEQKKVDAKVPTPPKRPPQPQPKFDPRQVAALLDKQTPQRKEAAGATINDALSLGAKGTAAQLSQSELDALRARLAQLWNPPVGAQNPDELVVTIRIRLRPDGTLDGAPGLVKRSGTPAGDASAGSALRAVLRGQPFNMLRPENYEAWKDIEVTFDPRDMIRG